MPRSSHALRSASRSGIDYQRAMRRRNVSHPLAPRTRSGPIVTLVSGVLRLFKRRRRRF